MSQFVIVNIHKLMQKGDAATSGTRYEFIKSCSLRFHRFMKYHGFSEGLSTIKETYN